MVAIVRLKGNYVLKYDRVLALEEKDDFLMIDQMGDVSFSSTCIPKEKIESCVDRKSVV